MRFRTRFLIDFDLSKHAPDHPKFDLKCDLIFDRFVMDLDLQNESQKRTNFLERHFGARSSPSAKKCQQIVVPLSKGLSEACFAVGVFHICPRRGS